jgi:hypothetical protein
MRRTALLVLACLITTGCHPGGGGGGAQAAKSQGGVLAPDEKGFRDAYGHAPRLHADLVAHDWERAMDELSYIDRQVAQIEGAEDVSKAVRRRIKKVRPMIARLRDQIPKKDPNAIHTASALVGAFAAITNDPAVRGWINESKPRETYP